MKFLPRAILFFLALQATPPAFGRTAAPRPNIPAPAAVSASTPTSAEMQKLRNEIRRLELFVKKLQAEIEAEHKYCEALEAHFKTLQESE